MVVVREGKNLKGRVLGFVLRTVGRGVLEKAFKNSVKTIESQERRGERADRINERPVFTAVGGAWNGAVSPNYLWRISMIFKTLNVNREGAVLFAEIAAPSGARTGS